MFHSWCSIFNNGSSQCYSCLGCNHDIQQSNRDRSHVCLWLVQLFSRSYLTRRSKSNDKSSDLLLRASGSSIIVIQASLSFVSRIIEYKIDTDLSSGKNVIKWKLKCWPMMKYWLTHTIVTEICLQGYKLYSKLVTILSMPITFLCLIQYFFRIRKIYVNRLRLLILKSEPAL